MEDVFSEGGQEEDRPVGSCFLPRLPPQTEAQLKAIATLLSRPSVSGRGEIKYSYSMVYICTFILNKLILFLFLRFVFL